MYVFNINKYFVSLNILLYIYIVLLFFTLLKSKALTLMLHIFYKLSLTLRSVKLLISIKMFFNATDFTYLFSF